MIANLDNLFRRAPLTDADVRTLHGVVRALAVKQPGGSRRAMLEDLMARAGCTALEAGGAHIADAARVCADASAAD